MPLLPRRAVVSCTAGVRGAPQRLLSAVWLSLLLACFLGSPTNAQTVREDFYATNGSVAATVLSGSTLYIGGNFTQVGPAGGGGLPTDATTGAVQTPWPKIDGWVYAIAPDGSGGWYLGGSFTAVAGLPRGNVAHILADGSVSPWDPHVTGSDPATSVNALAVSGGLVYAGGNFTSIEGQARHGIAALDAATGLATSWDPSADGPVAALAVSGNTVYAAGTFQTIGGQPRVSLAALDASTGLATAWTPPLLSCDPPGATALAVAGSRVCVGSNCGLVAIDATSGAISWDAHVDNSVLTLATNSATVYLGSGDISVGGQARSALAAVDAVTGLVTSWNPSVESDHGNVPIVRALALNGNSLYAAGSFLTVNGEARQNMAGFDLSTGLLSAWNPGPGVASNSTLSALAASGNVVYVGGMIPTVGGVVRNGAAALDIDTGRVLDWNPNVQGVLSSYWGGGVNAVAVGGKTVYLGGNFTSVGGQTRNGLAAVDAAAGSLVTSWNPDADQSVRSLLLSGKTLYVGGSFSRIGGQSRSEIAALDAATGLATAWDPHAGDQESYWGGVLALCEHGGTLYVGGSFNQMGGQTRNHLAALDARSGRVLPWDPNANYVVFTLAAGGNTVYAGGYFTAVGEQERLRLAALDATSGLVTAWNPAPNDWVQALAVSGGSVYAAGYFTAIGGQPRDGLAVVDAKTGLATPWTANASAFGQFGAWGADALAIRGDQAYVGGNFDMIGGAAQASLAAIQSGGGSDADAAGSDGRSPGTPKPGQRMAVASGTQSAPSLNVVDRGGEATLSYTVRDAAAVRVLVFDIAGRRVADLAGGVASPGAHVMRWDSRRLPSGIYFYRLDAGTVKLTSAVVHCR